jgi:hypothetical protein
MKPQYKNQAFIINSKVGWVSESSISSGWKGLGAASISNGYHIYFQNTLETHKYSRWNVNTTGYLLSSNDIAYSEILEAERTLNYDLLGDGRIGVAFIGTPKTLEDVTFAVTNTAPSALYGIKVGDSPIDFITYNGKYVDVGIDANWKCVAASRYYPNMGSTRNGFTLYWKHNSQNIYVIWILDDAFVFQSFLEVSVNSNESRFNFDWNGNGIIGS